MSFPILLSISLYLALLHFKNDILQIIPSTEPTVIQKYLQDYVILLQEKIDQYTSDLIVQSASYPLTLLPLNIIDQRLKEFVRLHHLDLLRTINYGIGKLNDTIHINRLSK